MSKSFFQNFPSISYNNKTARNLVLKAVIFKNVIDSFGAFYPYQIKDGERADTIAYEYYGDSEYYWLVNFSNQVVDPYYEWPLTNSQFDAYIKKKYGTAAIADSIIDHYEYVTQPNLTDNEAFYNNKYILSVDTYNKLSYEYQSNLTTDMKDFNPTNWTPITAYQKEFNLNESRRIINLISKAYVNQIEKEISGIFS